MTRQPARTAGLLLLAAASTLGWSQSALALEPPITEPTIVSTTTTSTSTSTSTSTTTSTTAQPVVEPQSTTTTSHKKQTTTTVATDPVASTSTTEPPPTSNPYLVPGGANVTADPTQPVSATQQEAVKNNDSTGTVVALVIAGLLVVALLIGVLTWRFWRNTRPERKTRTTFFDEPTETEAKST